MHQHRPLDLQVQPDWEGGLHHTGVRRALREVGLGRSDRVGLASHKEEQENQHPRGSGVGHTVGREAVHGQEGH